jgi:hypothetical protein
VEGPAELFVEAVARVLAWVDAHKAYLFLTAAVAVGLMAASAAMSLWGLIELGRLAHAASLMPFAALGGVERSREEAFRLIKGAPDPYGKFLEVAKAANAGRIGLAEPWNSLRMLIAPRPSEERRLVSGKAYGKLDERGKRALFYAVLALEEALGIYEAASRRAGRLEEAVRRVEAGEPPLKRAVYAADLGRLERLAEEEEEAFDDALKVLRERLNEYAVKHDLRDLLDVKEGEARMLAEAERAELSKYSDANFGVKAYAALLAYREHALGRRGAFGAAAKYWLEEGGSAWLLYYSPRRAYENADKTKAERPAAVEEMVAEAIRRLFLRPGRDRYSGFVEELTKGGKLALELEKETKTSYVFKLYRLEEDGGLKELKGVKLRIEKVGEETGVTYFLELDARWRDFFRRELGMVWEAAEELRERWPVEDPLPYMLGWSASDVSISGGRGARELYMSSSHFWQVAETKVLFGWSDAVRLRMSLTLEGPKLQLYVHAPLSRLDGAIKRSAGLAVGRSAEGGWLKRLDIKAGSWDDLKRQVAERWRGVVDVAVRHLGEETRSELEELRDKLNDDKIAREAVAPALLLIQAEKLGVDGESLRYFAMVISGAVGGDGYVSAAGRGEVGLASGEREIALLWGAAFAAHGIRAEVRGADRAFQVAASGGDAVRLARLYFLFGPPLLEGRDDRLKNNKLAEAVKLGAEGLSVSWEGLRLTKSGVTADLIISVGGIAVKYNVYLGERAIVLRFSSADRGRAELAARLLKLAGVNAEVRKESDRDAWYVKAYTDMLAAGRGELREALVKIVETARSNGWVDANKAERWLEKLESGRVLWEGWPKYHVGLTNNGALVVKYRSTNLDSIKQVEQQLKQMGLEKDVHFTVKIPKDDTPGYVHILREGLVYAAWLSVHGNDKQQRLADEFVEYILRRAKEEGEDMYKKALEIVNEGKSWGSLRLEGFEGRVEVDGRIYVVKVTGWGAEIEEKQDDNKLLRLKITAEVGRVEGEHTIVDRVVREYTITFGRYGNNAVVGFATASAKAPGGKEADAKRFIAAVKALTGVEPGVYRVENGKKIRIECYEEHLKGFGRFAELAGTIMKWLVDTSRRRLDTDLDATA